MPITRCVSRKYKRVTWVSVCALSVCKESTGRAAKVRSHLGVPYHWPDFLKQEFGDNASILKGITSSTKKFRDIMLNLTCPSILHYLST